MSGDYDISEDVVNVIFKQFEADVQYLKTIPDTTKTKTQLLLKILYEEDVFEKAYEFLTGLDELSEEVGHAAATVLLIELARQRLSPDSAQQYMSMFRDMAGSRASASQPVVIQPNAPQLGVLSGYWYYKAAKEIGKSALEAKQPVSTQITTEKEVVDILEWGRQLLPNFNLLREVFETDVKAVKRCGFNDPTTIENLKSELRLFVTNLIGVIRTFSRTAAEYRVDAVGDRRRDIARAVISLQMARYTAMGGLTKHDLFEVAQDAAGAQDAGER